MCMGACIRARFYSNFPPRGSKKKNCPPLRPLVQQDREARGQSASPGVRTCPPLFAAPLSALLTDLLRPLSPSFTAAPPPPLAAASLAGFSLSLLLFFSPSMLLLLSLFSAAIEQVKTGTAVAARARRGAALKGLGEGGRPGRWSFVRLRE